MNFVAFLFACLLAGAAVVVIICLLFYILILAISKILYILDIGCGCLGIMFLGFVAILFLALIFS